MRLLTVLKIENCIEGNIFIVCGNGKSKKDGAVEKTSDEKQPDLELWMVVYR